MENTGSKIFNSIGLGKVDIAIFIIALFVIGITLIVWNVLLQKKVSENNKRIDALLKGGKAASLEDVITKRFEDIDYLIEENNKKTKDISAIMNNLKYVVQKVGIVKYDAFSEMGGKLSFALVMLDKNNTGYVINAMHSREGCYTYIKEIIKGESYIPLGDEEQIALKKAMENDVL